jgi:hypothetical protein
MHFNVSPPLPSSSPRLHCCRAAQHIVAGSCHQGGPLAASSCGNNHLPPPVFTLPPVVVVSILCGRALVVSNGWRARCCACSCGSSRGCACARRCVCEEQVPETVIRRKMLLWVHQVSACCFYGRWVLMSLCVCPGPACALVQTNRRTGYHPLFAQPPSPPRFFPPRLHRRLVPLACAPNSAGSGCRKHVRW